MVLIKKHRLEENKLIPLWLVLQYPQILAHTNGRWSLAVKAKYRLAF